MTAHYVYTTVGDGSSSNPGGDNVPATAVSLSGATAVRVDATGNQYIADYTRIRFVPKSSGIYFGRSMTGNYVYTIAGNGTSSYGGDGGPAANSSIAGAFGLAVDSAGNVIFSDSGYSPISYRVRMIPRTSGTWYGVTMQANYVYTIAGTGAAGYTGDGGPAINATFKGTDDLALDTFGNLFIVDPGNAVIRMLPRGNGTYFNIPMTANNVYTVAGNGTSDFSGDGGAALAASIRPSGVYVDGAETLYIADGQDNRVRMVPSSNGTFFGISAVANNIYTIAGNTSPGFQGSYSGDGLQATNSELNFPNDLAMDANGNLLIADQLNSMVRVIAKTSGIYYGQSMTANALYRVVGSNSSSDTSDGIPALSANPTEINSVTVDSSSNVYFSAQGRGKIRYVPQSNCTP